MMRREKLRIINIDMLVIGQYPRQYLHNGAQHGDKDGTRRGENDGEMQDFIAAMIVVRIVVWGRNKTIIID